MPIYPCFIGGEVTQSNVTLRRCFFKTCLYLLCCADISCLIVQLQCYVSNRKQKVELGPTMNSNRNTIFSYSFPFWPDAFKELAAASHLPPANPLLPAALMTRQSLKVRCCSTTGGLNSVQRKVDAEASRGRDSLMSHTFAHVTLTTHMTADR